MKQALMFIDWFKTRGFLLGERKSRGVFYIVNSHTLEELEFEQIWQAQMYVKEYPIS